MTSFFTFLRGLTAARYGTSRGNERNVHCTKAGPGRMPPHRHQHKRSGRKVAKLYGQLARREP